MAITHKKVATLPDDPAYEVVTSDWNDTHDIAPGTITEAMLEAAALIPVGVILMWSGTIATIPTRWKLCDGTQNAPGPDLRDKFVVGAKQDDAGVAKSNIEGSLKSTGGATGHSHSGHANLSHAGAAVGDHTGLTHSLAIADHPDLTHAALSHAATTITQPAATVPTHSGSHAAATVSRPSLAVASALGSRPSGSIASHAVGSVPSGAIVSRADLSRPSLTGASGADATTPSRSVSVVSSLISYQTGTASRSTGVGMSPTNAQPTGSQPTLTGVSYPSHSHASGADVSMPSLTIPSAANASGPTRSFASGVDVSVPAQTIASGVDISIPTASHSHGSSAVAVADLSLPSLSHQAIGTHKGTDYGVHQITPPAAHGAAGTLVHAVTQADPHVVSAHDTVSNVPSYYALAFIQRMAA